MANRLTDTPLFPTDVSAILDRYGDILETYEHIPDKGPIYPQVKLTPPLLSVLFPLKEHPVHGITGLHAVERYKDGQVKHIPTNGKSSVPR